RPASCLGYRPPQDPARLPEAELSLGTAWLCFPEGPETRCTAALILDVDPVGLVRGKSGGDGLMQQYVNDRPYAASSFLSVAMGRTLREGIVRRSARRQARPAPAH